MRSCQGVRTFSLLVMAVTAVGLLSPRLTAAPDNEEQAQIKQWHALYQKRAEAIIALERPGNDPRTLTLVKAPLQMFSNSVRPDQVHGSVHLWTDDGRPRMIGSVWSALDQNIRTQRNLCYEFHSLSESPLEASINPGIIWNPKDAGIEWIPLKGAPEPAKTRALRLVQMRQLMAEIRAEIETRESDLRLLTQPIYRYPESVKGVVDGAIFSYVMGTDPEIFVMLEAQPLTAESGSTWQLAPVRFTGSGLSLKRGDVPLWKQPVWESFARDKIYDFLYGVEHLDAQRPSE